MKTRTFYFMQFCAEVSFVVFGEQLASIFQSLFLIAVHSTLRKREVNILLVAAFVPGLLLFIS